jgi:hypothetical protein
MLSDLVTLRERGTYSGLMALYAVPLSVFWKIADAAFSSWAIGGGVGPVIGGALAEHGKWYVPYL